MRSHKFCLFDVCQVTYRDMFHGHAVVRENTILELIENKSLHLFVTVTLVEKVIVYWYIPLYQWFVWISCVYVCNTVYVWNVYLFTAASSAGWLYTGYLCLHHVGQCMSKTTGDVCKTRRHAFSIIYCRIWIKSLLNSIIFCEIFLISAILIKKMISPHDMLAQTVGTTPVIHDFNYVEWLDCTKKTYWLHLADVLL